MVNTQGQNRMVMPMDINLDKFRYRKVVFYGRVSTEHEAQISALENQLQWYDDQAKYHSNWKVLRKYIDEGITGTQAKKRPAFLEMIEDAKKGQFDLIVTREVCRFARNTVDTLVTTRELKTYGVEVFFVEDNIWTMDGDGELRLTIMATLAQEESRKTSERVRAGQKISRDNGVLYGNGNILGYDRDKAKGTYVINPEHAETVRIIYNLYAQGLGIKKIVGELTRLKRKDGFGLVRWESTKISRILHNATYKGYKVYLKSFCNNHLDQKRIKNLDESTYLYVKGDFEPIISEELWERCRQIREAKSMVVKHKVNNPVVGYNRSNDVWVHKLVCSCGTRMSRNKWRRNINGEIIYGYKCYNQLNNGSKKLREEADVTTDGYCDMPEICDWKLELMAYTIFKNLKLDFDSLIQSAYGVYAQNYTNEKSALKNSRAELVLKKDKLKRKLDNLTSMRMDEEITKEEYLDHRQKIKEEIEQLDVLIEDSAIIQPDNSITKLTAEEFNLILKSKTDVSQLKLDRNFLEEIIYRIVPIKHIEFNWYLNILPHKCEWCEQGKNVRTITINYDMAHDYRQKSKNMLRRNQWEDLIINVIV